MLQGHYNVHRQLQATHVYDKYPAYILSHSEQIGHIQYTRSVDKNYGTHSKIYIIDHDNNTYRQVTMNVRETPVFTLVTLLIVRNENVQ